MSGQAKINGFSAKAEFISFDEPKVRVDTLRAKRNQEKAFPDGANA